MMKRSAPLIPNRLALACLGIFVAAGDGCSCGQRNFAPQARTEPDAMAPAPSPTPVNPAPQPQAQDVVKSSDGGVGPAGKAGGPPPVDPMLSEKQKENLATCRKFLAELNGPAPHARWLGPPSSDALLRGPEVFDLVMCHAVELDSEAQCQIFSSPQQCLDVVSTFHAARGGGKKFMFTDADYKICKAHPTEPLGPFCDAFRDVAQSGDVSKCPTNERIGSACRALFTLDKTLCKIGGTMDAGCEKGIDARKKFGAGLEALAKSGSDGDKRLARAALGDRKACGELTSTIESACVTMLNAGLVGPAK